MPLAVVRGIPSKMLAALGSLDCPQSAGVFLAKLSRSLVAAPTGALITSVRDYVALWIRRLFSRAGLAMAKDAS